MGFSALTGIDLVGYCFFRGREESQPIRSLSLSESQPIESLSQLGFSASGESQYWELIGLAVPHGREGVLLGHDLASFL